MEDIHINLTSGKELSALTVCAGNSEYNDLLQRAVMLLLTSDSPELLIDGCTFYQAVVQSTTAGIDELRTNCGYYSDVLKRMLVTDSDESLSSLSLDIAQDGRSVVVSINITRADDSEISGEFTI